LKDVLYFIRKFLEKPIREQCFYIEVIFWLGLSRIAILVLPFKFIASFLGDHMLYEKDHTREQILNLYRFIDWLMVLPEALSKRFNTQHKEYEEEQKCLISQPLNESDVKREC